jgi:STE24 endopeptidase
MRKSKHSRRMLPTRRSQKAFAWGARKGYGVLRRAPRTWWVWGSVVTIVFLIFTALISPVYIAPRFNKYTKLEDPRIKEPILSLARANGIPTSEV